jgi:hypothetical protein
MMDEALYTMIKPKIVRKPVVMNNVLSLQALYAMASAAS